MARISKAVFKAYYQNLSFDMQCLHMFFRHATEYHDTHRTDLSATVQERRWARSGIEMHVFPDRGPHPIMRRCERMLAAGREVRIARIRQRRYPAAMEVLRFNLNAHSGDVVSFPSQSQIAARKALSA